MNDAQIYSGAAVLGAVAGMRATSAPSVVSQLASAGLIPEEGTPIAWLHNPAVGKALHVLTAGEAVADKVKSMPARTKPGPLAARAITGGISGAAVSTAARRPWWIGALIGAAAAIGATFGTYKLRKWMTEEKEVPNTIVGLIEDAIVAGSSYLVLSSLKQQRGLLAKT
jgi:uncharacterized membrane protein